MDRSDEALDRLFQAYRESLPDVEGGPDFMPGLWRKIDARRKFSLRLRFWARATASAAAVVCLLFLGFGTLPLDDRQSFYTHTYVDVLVEDDAPETQLYAEVVHVQNPGGQR